MKITQKQVNELQKLASENGWEWDTFGCDISEDVYFFADAKDAYAGICNSRCENDLDFKKIKRLLSRKILRVGDNFVVTKLNHGVQVGCTTVPNKAAKQILAYLKWKESEPELPIVNDNCVSIYYDYITVSRERLSIDEVKEVAKFAGLVK